MPATEYTINRAVRVTPDLVAAFAELVPQLSPGRAPPSGAELELILGDDRVHLFVARSSDGAIRGAVALVFYRVPTGVRARIEDLVVARSHRGLGLGRALMLCAMQAARDGQAHVLDLTSNPSRTRGQRPVPTARLSTLGDQCLPLGARSSAGPRRDRRLSCFSPAPSFLV